METYAEGEKGEQQRERDKLRERNLFSLRDRVDPETHKVRIWDLNEMKFVEREPIDAAEAISVGSAVLDKPEGQETE